MPFQNHSKNQQKPQKWPICKAPDAKEWHTPFLAEGNAARRRRAASVVFARLAVAADVFFRGAAVAAAGLLAAFTHAINAHRHWPTTVVQWVVQDAIGH